MAAENQNEWSSATPRSNSGATLLLQAVGRIAVIVLRLRSPGNRDGGHQYQEQCQR
jgi:hypothetical protein